MGEVSIPGSSALLGSAPDKPGQQGEGSIKIKHTAILEENACGSHKALWVGSSQVSGGTARDGSGNRKSLKAPWAIWESVSLWKF